MRATIKQIAELCGVSVGTVDRALNNKTGINIRTKEKILRVAKELNYRPHLLARGLVHGKTNTLGVVVIYLRNRFFSQLVDAVERRARERGYFVYLTLTNDEADGEEKCLDHLASQNVDGVILFSKNQGKEFNRYLKTLDTPIVSIINQIHPMHSFVGINDYSAIYDAVQFLFAKGYRKFIYVRTNLSPTKRENFSLEQRLAGFRNAVKDCNLIKPTVAQVKEQSKILEAVSSVSNELPMILCSTDLIALEVLSYLKQNGIEVPRDVGLMGFDDIDVLKYVTPRLTTIAYPIEETGKTAVDLLVDKIEGRNETRSVVLDYTIIERQST